MALKKKLGQHNENKMQVLIVDDHPVVRDGLTTIINHERDMNVCGEAEDACQALKAVTKLKPGCRYYGYLPEKFGRDRPDEES